MRRNKAALTAVATLALMPGLMGCGAAAAGAAVGAGAAAAAIAYDNRGATTHLDSSVNGVATAAIDAFSALGITYTERKMEDNGIELQGSEGDWKYVVDIERGAGAHLTEVEVTVSRDVADYSQERAEELLRAIMQRL